MDHFFVSVAHFFLIHNDGSTQDVSSDQGMSPIMENIFPDNFITNGPGLASGYDTIGYTLINDGKNLIANSDNSKRVIQWEFGSSENYETDGTIKPNCVHKHGDSASSSNGNPFNFLKFNFVRDSDSKTFELNG